MSITAKEFFPLFKAEVLRVVTPMFEEAFSQSTCRCCGQELKLFEKPTDKKES